MCALDTMILEYKRKAHFVTDEPIEEFLFWLFTELEVGFVSFQLYALEWWQVNPSFTDSEAFVNILDGSKFQSTVFCEIVCEKN